MSSERYRSHEEAELACRRYLGAEVWKVRPSLYMVRTSPCWKLGLGAAGTADSFLPPSPHHLSEPPFLLQNVQNTGLCAKRLKIDIRASQSPPSSQGDSSNNSSPGWGTSYSHLCSSPLSLNLKRGCLWHSSPLLPSTPPFQLSGRGQLCPAPQGSCFTDGPSQPELTCLLSHHHHLPFRSQLASLMAKEDVLSPTVSPGLAGDLKVGTGQKAYSSYK